MLKYRRIIQDSARSIASAANRAVGDFIDDAGQTSDFTGAILGRMKHAMDGYDTRGVRWTARTLAAKTHSVQQSAIGADFLGVVEFDLPEYSVKKGFLAHVTHIERGQSVTPGEWASMSDRCRQMLSITAESFVFICARTGIVVIPALAVVSATTPRNPHHAYSRTALRFYQDHFECFVGDLELASADVAALARFHARHLLYLGATQIQPADLQLKLGAL